MTLSDLRETYGRDRTVAVAALERGLNVIKEGHLWHITGIGVNITTVRLEYVTPNELRPFNQSMA